MGSTLLKEGKMKQKHCQHEIISILTNRLSKFGWCVGGLVMMVYDGRVPRLIAAGYHEHNFVQTDSCKYT